MSDELKPCPFCGSDFVELHKAWKNDDCECRAWIRCESCGAQMHEYPTRHLTKVIEESNEIVIRLWNKRAAVTDEHFALAVHDGEVWRKERTCKFVADAMHSVWDEDDVEIETGEVADGADMYCENCGYPMMRDECNGWWEEERGPNGGWLLTPRFEYCPCCGSHMTDWDGRKAGL